MLGTLFTVNAEGQMAAMDPKQYLSNELGWTLKAKQEDSIAQAITAPEKFIQARQHNVNGIINEQVQPVYKKALEEFTALGLPSEMIRTLAMKRAQNSFNEYMEIEELKHPGYSRAIGNMEAHRDLEENRFDKEAKRAIKEKAIAKYKAKKRASKKP